LLPRHTPPPPLFPYTTLFRSTDALYQRYQAQLDTWSDVAIRYKSRGQRNWMGASDLAELKRRIGARAGLHLDIRHLQESPRVLRSEEHTSELQSRENLVCRLL